MKIERKLPIIVAIALVSCAFLAVNLVKPAPDHDAKAGAVEHDHPVTTWDKETAGPKGPAWHSRRVVVVLTPETCTAEPVEKKPALAMRDAKKDSATFVDAAKWDPATAPPMGGLPFNAMEIRKVAELAWKHLNPSATILLESGGKLDFVYEHGPNCEVGAQLTVEVFSRVIPDTVVEKEKE